MKVKFNGELRSVIAKEYEFNGNKGVSYSVTLEVDDDSVYMKATQEIFNLYKGGYIKKGQQCTFIADYSPAFKSMKIVNLETE